MCLFSFFKFKISRQDSEDFGTRKIVEINSPVSSVDSFITPFFNNFSISSFKNISSLGENFISNVDPSSEKLSSPNYRGIPETVDKISLSLVSACQEAICLPIDPEVNLFTLFVDFDLISFTLVNSASVEGLETSFCCFDWLVGFDSSNFYFCPGSLKKPYYLMLRDFLTLSMMIKQLMSCFLAEID